MAPSSGLKSQPAVAPSPSTTSASELIYHVRENVRSANAVKACFSSLCALSRDKATKEYARQRFAEHYFRLNVLHCTAMARILISAECSAVS